MNAITVGAQHLDSVSSDLPDTVVDLFERGGPAAYGAIGFGYRRSIKPDVLMPGGREIYQRPVGLHSASGLVEFSPAPTLIDGPGLRVAAPGLSGSLDGTVHSAGSSNAAALASRTLDQILDVLEQAEADEGGFEFPDPQYHPVLAKALLVHASGWGTSAVSLATLLGFEPKHRRRDLTQLLGYGSVDGQRVATASRVRPVLLGAASITKDQRHTYRVPIPAAVGGTTAWRRATVTLAWLSPVNTRSQRHRMARLRFEPPRSELGADPTEAEHNAIFRGTVQHQVLEGTAAIPFVSGDVFEINVDCRVDAGRLANPVRYGLAVSIEMAQSVQADIHAQVRAGLRVLVEQRIRPQI